jgi:hypothetical protein
VDDPAGTLTDTTGHTTATHGRTGQGGTQQDAQDATCQRMVAGSIPAPDSEIAGFRAICALLLSGGAKSRAMLGEDFPMSSVLIHRP